MDGELITQFNKLIVKSTSIAIVLPSFVTVDDLCAAVALEMVLKQQGKNSAIVCSAAIIPLLPFFSSVPKVHKTISSSDEFIVHLSNDHAEAAELRYEKDATGLQIYIRPKDGQFKSSDVTTSPTANSFDLLIILGASNFEEIGDLYTGNTSLFFNTTKIAISNRASHDYFAALNIVNTQSAAISEMVYDLIAADQKIFTTDIISTALLAGMIAQTQSFRDAKTTPDILTKAARLVNAGARQQDIIQYLFKTKSFPLLQLWGRAMARVKSYNEQSVLYSIITQQDFEKTKTDIQFLPGVLLELTSMAASVNMLVIAAEMEVGLQIAIAGLPHSGIRKLAQALTGAESPSPVPLVGNYEHLIISAPGVTAATFETLLLSHLQ